MSEQPPQQPWGQQPQPPYGQPPYGQPAYGPPPPPGGYASFGQRLVGTLWDILYMLPWALVLMAGYVVTVIGAVMLDEDEDAGGPVLVIGLALLLLGLALTMWFYIRNYFLRQGRTGYTFGKAKVGIRLVTESTLQPAGAGSAVLRWLLHSVINQACYIDYLWAVWDEKHQTLTDKVLSTIVVNQPEVR